MAVLRVIYVLDKDNERMIHKQYKVKYESQRISLAAYKEALISSTWHEVNRENETQYLFIKVSALQKVEFSSQVGLICQSQGPDWEMLHFQDLGWVHQCTWKPCISVSPWTLSVHFSCSVMSDSSQPHGLQHTWLSCPPLSPRVCSNSCLWCHPTISSSVVPFSSCLQSFPASRSFPVSHFFASGGQTIGASASVLPMNIQDWFPLGLTGLISLQSKGLP